MSHELGTVAFPLPARGQLRELETQIGIRLNGHTQLPIVVAERRHGTEGRAHTYYAKQLAQHAVVAASDLPISVNDIEVV